MAKQQIKTEARVTNILIVNAEEIEALVRARYPHIPPDAKLTAETDLGCLDDILANVRMTWTNQSGDTKDVDIPPGIATPAVLGGTTCRNPRCPALGCRSAPGPGEPKPDSNETQEHTYLPRPKDRLSNAEFEDGF
jgi:hypothetical protein